MQAHANKHKHIHTLWYPAPMAAHPSHLCLGRVSRALSSRDTRSSTRFNKSSCGSCLPSGSGRTGACPVALCTPHAGYLQNERNNTGEHAFNKSIIALLSLTKLMNMHVHFQCQLSISSAVIYARFTTDLCPAKCGESSHGFCYPCRCLQSQSPCATTNSNFHLLIQRWRHDRYSQSPTRQAGGKPQTKQENSESRQGR